MPNDELRGPIPLSWWTRACLVPGGKSILAVASAIWFESGLRQSFAGLKLTSATCGRFGLTPTAKSHSLRALEKAGLIRVERNAKKSPIVTILEPGLTLA
jgi:DNA-binding MarR family transcriptional regulator